MNDAINHAASNFNPFLTAICIILMVLFCYLVFGHITKLKQKHRIRQQLELDNYYKSQKNKYTHIENNS